ncbi:unnamed protein product [Rotaria sordida]|nr:unnamed protein product [Rotaria sordida]
MTYLEKLTLYLRLHDRNIFVNGTHLHREILMHMSQLHTFIFYISTEIEINDSIDRLSDNDIQQTFTNIGYHRVACALIKHAKNADELKMIDRKKLHQSIMQSPSYRKVRKDEEFADWMKQWCKISEYEEIEHIQNFFRMLLSDDTSNYYYSFCYNDRMIFDINVCSNDRYLDITIL